MALALCPGSFDPPTNGHVDIVERAARHFDRVIVAVLQNPDKKPLLEVEERVKLLEAVLGHLPGVEVASFEGLLVDRHVTMADLKSVLRLFASSFLGSDVHIRFRPSFFPFTEPSVAVDIRVIQHGQAGGVLRGRHRPLRPAPGGRGPRPAFQPLTCSGTDEVWSRSCGHG